eukprot:g8245.t2
MAEEQEEKEDEEDEEEVAREINNEVEEKSSFKNGSITTGDFLDLGFNDEETEDANQTEVKSSEYSDQEKASTERLSRDHDETSIEDGSGNISLAEIKDIQDTQEDD